MNGIRFSMDMGVSPLRFVNEKRKTSHIVTNDSATELSTKNIQETDNATSLSQNIKKETIIYERRKHKRLSILDYLLMSESHIHYEDFVYNQYGKTISNEESKQLHNAKKIIEKAKVEVLDKFEFASLLQDFSEQIITHERQYRDGDDLSKEQKVLNTLTNNAQLIKQFFNEYNDKYISKNEKQSNHYMDKIKEIFEFQRQFNNLLANHEFQEEYFHYIDEQIKFVKKNSHINLNKSNFSSFDLFNQKLL